MSHQPDNYVMWLEQMIDAIQCALKESGGRNIVSVTVDGTTVWYTREEGMKNLKTYRRELAFASGRIARSTGVNLSHGGPTVPRGALPPEAG